MSKLINLVITAILLTTVLSSCEENEKGNIDTDIAVTGISLNTNDLVLFVGEQQDLVINVLPEDAKNQTVIWSTSDSSIVAVDMDVESHSCYLTAMAEGNTIITITTVDGGYAAECNVTVIPVKAHYVTLDHHAVLLAINGTVNLTPTIYPENTTDQTTEWSTSNASVVTVSNGVLTAMAEGDATITVKTTDGGHTAECNVHVTPYCMTMTMKECTSHISLSMAGTAGISIDWGDGTVEFSSLSNDYTTQHFSHEYIGEPNHGITIAGYSITNLICRQNSIITLDVSNNTLLQKLNCADNMLINLDVSDNTMLTELYCSHNMLTSLDISKNTKLEVLSVESNQLTTLNLESNTALIDLDCSYNKLINLNVIYNNKTRPGGYSGMSELNCSHNQLTALTLGEGSIQDLNCSFNRLTELNMSNVGTNGYFKLNNNLLEAPALDAVFRDLHTIALALVGSINIVYIGGNPGVNDCNPSIATDKRWDVNTNTITH